VNRETLNVKRVSSVLVRLAPWRFNLEKLLSASPRFNVLMAFLGGLGVMAVQI
jgi:hypothetical protein